MQLNSLQILAVSEQKFCHRLKCSDEVMYDALDDRIKVVSKPSILIQTWRRTVFLTDI
jgi:hypothetical protein